MGIAPLRSLLQIWVPLAFWVGPFAFQPITSCPCLTSDLKRRSRCFNSPATVCRFGMSAFWRCFSVFVLNRLSWTTFGRRFGFCFSRCWSPWRNGWIGWFCFRFWAGLLFSHTRWFSDHAVDDLHFIFCKVSPFDNWQTFQANIHDSDTFQFYHFISKILAHTSYLPV